MITSALITELRREFGDLPKTHRVARDGNGAANTFNLGDFPIIEASYTVQVAGSTLTSAHATSGYSLDLDNGDLVLDATPGNGEEVRVDFKHAHWRDRNWNEVINGAISHLNARGFFRQVTRESIYLSADVSTIPGPTRAIDAYELLYVPTGASDPVSLGVNWSYQQDANKIVLGAQLTSALSGRVSYMRNLSGYAATSATLDVKDDWLELLKKRAGASYFRSVASKIAQQGSATVEEGHFSFTNLRTMARDLEDEFERLAQRKKPTRPAKEIQYRIPGGGIA